MATIIYVRPNGSEIEVESCDETKAVAKQFGWKKKKVAKPSPQIELGENNA